MVRSGELLRVVTPNRRTSSGRRGRAWETRFWTWTWARSRLAPMRKVTVRVIVPSALDREDM